ncbi:MAG: YhdP family protein [Acidiferrobacterales bacterium]
MKKTIHRYVFHIGKWTFACARWLVYTGLVLSVVFAVLLVLVKIWLPDIAEKKSEIENFVTKQTGLEVTAAKISPYWDGIYPGLIISDVLLVNPENRKKQLKFSKIRASLAILPFLRGSVEFSEVVLHKKNIVIEKKKSGEILVNDWRLPEANNESEGGFLKWLGRLHHVEIMINEFVWNDRTTKDKSFLIENLELHLDNNGNQHKLRVEGDFPPELCRSCTVTVDFTNKALTLAELTGSLQIDAIDLDLGNFPESVKMYLPNGLDGLFQTQIASTFSKGTLVSLKGHVIADNLVLPLPSTKIVNIDTMSGHIDWHANKDDWRLLVTDLNLGLTAEEWRAGKLRIEKTGNKSLVYLERAKLNDLSEYIGRINTDIKEVELIKKLQPSGEVRNLRLEFENTFSSLANTSIKANLVDLEFKQVGNYPFAKGISGTLSMKGEKGKFVINSKNATIVVPQVFRAPIVTKFLTGTASWYKRKDAWELNVQDLGIIAEDVKAESNFQVLLHDDKSRLPTVKVRVDFREGKGYRTPLFYPKNLASSGLLAWLDKALQTGYVKKGYAILEGSLDNFPFKDGSGKFEVMVDITDATLDYLPGWAPLEDADALLKFNGGEMVITIESGNIGGLEVRNATAYISDLTTEAGSVIQISGEAGGPIKTAINILRKTPQGNANGPWAQWLNPEIRVQGYGDLDIQIAFRAGADENPVINGVYTIDNGTVRLPWRNINVSRIQGNAGFDEFGPKSGRISGKLFGGPVVLDISRPEITGQKISNETPGEKTPLVQINASGRVMTRELTDTFAGWLRPYISGYSDWQATLAWDNKINFKMNSDLMHAGVKLPVPFKKPKHVKSNLMISTISTSENNLLLAYNLYGASNGKLRFGKNRGKWDFYGANIGLFEAITESPTTAGVKLRVAKKDFDADAWSDVLQSFLKVDDNRPPYIKFINASFGNVDLFDRHLGGMDIDLKRSDKAFVGTVIGKSIEGKIKFNTGDDFPGLNFDLARLYIPREGFRESEDRVNPRSFPSMSIRAGQFKFGDAVFGETILEGSRESLGFRVTRFVINGSHYNMIGRGRWYRVGDRDDARVKLKFTSDNVGKALISMGSSDQIVDGKGFVEADLRWSKTMGLETGNMNGNGQINFKKGRFLQVEQGASKMFGLLDMSSIIRYLRLDLSSIFGKGFSFNTVKAKFSIKDGDAYTTGLKIEGPSAKMLLTGRIGIDMQDFDMVVGVNPSLTDTVALTVGGLVAPTVGIAMLIIKNIFNTELVPSPSLNYSIKGAWANPEVKRITGDKSDTQEQFDDDSTS